MSYSTQNFGYVIFVYVCVTSGKIVSLSITFLQ